MENESRDRVYVLQLCREDGEWFLYHHFFLSRDEATRKAYDIDEGYLYNIIELTSPKSDE